MLTESVQLGEAKTFIGHGGKRFLYGYLRGRCDPALWRRMPRPSRVEYATGGYRNFICREENGGCVDGEDALLLHYPRSARPDPRTARAKNFLLFTAPTAHGGHSALFAVALIVPHRVYRVDTTSGRMVPLLSGKNRSSDDAVSERLGFRDPIGLSAGPLRVTLPDGRAQLLVAGHTRRGYVNTPGGPMRMSFFYSCDPTPPFAIRTVTPLVNFGLSPSLEYMNHMEQSADGRALVISLGVDDCASVLLRVPLASVLRLLRSVPRPAGVALERAG